MSKVIKKVFVVYRTIEDGDVYYRVKKGYAEAKALLNLKWSDQCLVRYLDGTIEMVNCVNIHDKFNEAERDALLREENYDGAQAYYNDFLECAQASDFVCCNKCQ